jgi:hypothetical protein
MFPSHLSTRAPEHLTLRTRTTTGYPERYVVHPSAYRSRRRSSGERRLRRRG